MTIPLLLALLLLALPAAAQRVAVLGARPPLVDAPQVDALRQRLTARGFSVTVLPPEAVADPARLSRARVDLLVVPGADAFPADAQSNLLTYLRAKGRLLIVGPPPFTRACYPTDGGWKSWDALVDALPDAAAVVDTGDPDAWTRSTNDPKSPARLIRDGDALRWECERFTNWDTVAAPPSATRAFPAGAELFAFRARGDENTTALVLEWREADGSRWMTSVPLTPRWRRFVLTPDRFRFWADGAAPGRGGPGDRFHPERARTFAVGLANSHALLAPGPKRFWIAGIAAVRAPAAPPLDPPTLEGMSPAHKRLPDGRPIPRSFGAVPVLPDGRLQTVAGGWLWRAFTGQFAGAAWGQAAPERVADLARALTRPGRLVHAGPIRWTWTDGERPTWAATLANEGARPLPTLCRVQAGGQSASARVTVPARGLARVRLTLPGPVTPGTLAWTFAAGDETLSRTITVLPRNAPVSVAAVRVKDGRFLRDEKPWRPVGVNYWPLWVSGQEPDAFRKETWLSPRQYDPGLIDADLDRARALGIDLLSVQYTALDQADALRDFLARCRRRGILANVFIDGGHPLAPDLERLTALIRAARLDTSEALFAYDVAWEPHVGDAAARRRFDAAWEAWVIDSYGSVAKAERDWGVRFASPPDAWFTTDGPHRTLIAAYRRFIQTRIRDGYRQVRSAIRGVDSFHLIGARSGYGGNGALAVEGALPFDLKAGARHLDFVSPEGYALTGGRDAVRAGGGFVTAYARWASGGKPVFWAEFGVSVHPAGPQTLAAQAETIANIWAMVADSGADGGAAWWWPGGLRVDEGSDYGLIAPDGVPRPAARALTRLPVAPHPPLHDLRIEPDRDARGFAALWERGKASWTPSARIVTAGTGTTTADVPLLALGGAPAAAPCPLQFVDAEAERCQAERRSAAFTLRVAFGNDGEAAWQASGPGAVVLQVFVDGKLVRTEPLAYPTPRFASASWSVRDLDGQPGQRVAARLAIAGRTPEPLPFGDVAVAVVR